MLGIFVNCTYNDIYIGGKISKDNLKTSRPTLNFMNSFGINFMCQTRRHTCVDVVPTKGKSDYQTEYGQFYQDMKMKLYT